MVTVWWSAACLIHYSFLNPIKETITSEMEKPLHLRSMLSKSMRCTENCNICSWHWSTERAQFSMAMPDHTLYNQCFKSWMNWATKFCLIHHIHLISQQLTTTSSSILTFAVKMLSQPAWGIKCFPRVHWVLKHRFLHYKNKETYFSLQKCVDFNGSYFD